MAFFAHGKGVSFENRWTLNNETLMKFPLIVPPFEVQKSIANLLDQKCTEIDSLSTDIQSQIDILEEYKKSVITESVTKGLNPDVKMKDSGIEWIGMVPKHWSISRVKFVTTCRDGERIPVDKNLRNDGIYPYWGAGSIMDYIDRYIFDDDIVLLGEDGAPFFDKTRDVAHHITYKCWVNNHIHVLQSIKNIMTNSYLTYFLNIVDYGSYINGSILNKLTQGNMNEIKFVSLQLRNKMQLLNGSTINAVKLKQ
jgi:type I restriction enzyme S subunit